MSSYVTELLLDRRLPIPRRAEAGELAAEMPRKRGTCLGIEGEPYSRLNFCGLIDELKRRDKELVSLRASQRESSADAA